MSKELIYILITKMHNKLNFLIVTSDYDLLCEKVQLYSRRLDRVLVLYNKSIKKRSHIPIETINSDRTNCV